VVHDLERYTHTTDLVVELLCRLFSHRASRAGVRVVIESYAFYGRGHTGNNYKLHEVTGCCKLRLWKEGFTNWSESPVSVWRRRCFGNPRAGKREAFDFVLRQLPGLDLLGVCRRKLGKNGTVPCPVQDMCEAYCIAWAALGPEKKQNEEAPVRSGKKQKKAGEQGGRVVKKRKKIGPPKGPAGPG
jgi:hypothetical protein